MINLEEFQVPSSLASPHSSSSILQLPSLSECGLLSFQSISLEEDQEVLQIKSIYEDMELSENFLDRMVSIKQTDSFKETQILTQQEDSDSTQKLKKMNQKLKNQTKNIPKNFGKGIITFVERNEPKIKCLTKKMGINYSEFIAKLKEEKKSINTIADLRRLWTSGTWAKCIRMISNLFLRRHALEYIFNSRISNFASHIKYRASLWEAIKNPNSFNHIKQY